MSELSPATRSLLRAAREDGPSAASRARIWNGVGGTAAGGSVAGGAAAGKGLAGAATAKLFVMGALLGSAITVGVAAMVLGVGTPHLQTDPTLAVSADTDIESIAPAATAAPVAEAPHRAKAALAVPSQPVRRVEHADQAAAPPRSREDSLEREAELVAEARGAVVRGDGHSALSALHAAQALPAHVLEPEELALEVKALRALGRLDEANAVDARLRAKFPDHALAR
jgi:hypothetical protein